VPAGTCQKADCTVATTGTCLLSHTNIEECPNFVPPTEVQREPAAVASMRSETDSGARTKTEIGRKFHLGNELGALDSLDVMRARYGHLIGIVGSTAVGKTCFLSSLYLMASSGILPSPYRFAGSLTLQGFEDRARGVRQWPNGRLPAQLADRTVLSDPRQPSLLHLGIHHSGTKQQFDLLLTDLPGEWTDNLALRSANADSFKFLCRADGIILVIDGGVFVSDERHVELQRMRYFTERLAQQVGVTLDTPFVVLVSKADEIQMQMPPAAEELTDHVRKLGFPATTILAASFSRKPDEVKNGVGVFTAIETLLFHPVSVGAGYDAPPYDQTSTRTFQRFKG
jgi:hypothetical protein